jgi:hypothetical protein
MLALRGVLELKIGLEFPGHEKLVFFIFISCSSLFAPQVSRA